MVARIRLATHQEKCPEWEQSPNLHLCALAGTVEGFIPTDGSELPNTGLHHIMVTNYSTLHKLLAVTLYVHRFMFNCCHHQMSQQGPLSADELHRAHMKWIADC